MLPLSQIRDGNAGFVKNIFTTEGTEVHGGNLGPVSPWLRRGSHPSESQTKHLGGIARRIRPFEVSSASPDSPVLPRGKSSCSTREWCDTELTSMLRPPITPVYRERQSYRHGPECERDFGFATLTRLRLRPTRVYGDPLLKRSRVVISGCQGSSAHSIREHRRFGLRQRLQHGGHWGHGGKPHVHR